MMLLENSVSAKTILRVWMVDGIIWLVAPSTDTVFGGTSSSPKSGLMVITFFRSDIDSDCSLFSKSLTDSAKDGLVIVLDENDLKPVWGSTFNLPQTLITRWILFFRFKKAFITALPPALVPTREIISFLEYWSIRSTNLFSFGWKFFPSRQPIENMTGLKPYFVQCLVTIFSPLVLSPSPGTKMTKCFDFIYVSGLPFPPLGGIAMTIIPRRSRRWRWRRRHYPLLWQISSK